MLQTKKKLNFAASLISNIRQPLQALPSTSCSICILKCFRYILSDELFKTNDAIIFRHWNRNQTRTRRKRKYYTYIYHKTEAHIGLLVQTALSQVRNWYLQYFPHEPSSPLHDATFKFIQTAEKEKKHQPNASIWLSFVLPTLQSCALPPMKAHGENLEHLVRQRKKAECAMPPVLRFR